MRRRHATVWVASMILAGCGGGGGGGDGGAATASSSSGSAEPPPPVPAPSPAPVVAEAPPAVPHIAIWGDSLAVTVGLELSHVIQNRQIFNGGVSGETSQQIAARQAADTQRRDWISLFWYGHNNMTQDPATAGAQIKSDLAASIARLAPGTKFLVLSVVNNAESPRGSARYQAVMQLNSELAALYPRNFLDIRSFLVNQYDPSNAQQRAEFEQDLPSSSLRFDLIHFTYFGSDLVAKWLKQQVEARGW